MALDDNTFAKWQLDDATGDPAVDSIGDLDLTDGNSPVSIAGVVGNAKQFTAASSHWIAGQSTAMGTGDIDFAFSAYVRFRAFDATSTPVITKWDATRHNYHISHDNTTGRLHFFVAGTGGTPTRNVSSVSYGTIPLNIWLLFVAEHDSVNNHIGIQVYSSGRTSTGLDTVAHTEGVHVDNNALYSFAAWNGLTDFADIDLDDVRHWRDYIPDAQDRTDMINALPRQPAGRLSVVTMSMIMDRSGIIGGSQL